MGNPAPLLQRPWVRRCLRLVRFLALAYGAIVVALVMLENQLLFRPTPASRGWWPPQPERLTVQELNLITNDGRRVHAWWCPREGAAGAVLYCHGNAGNLSYRQALVRDWHDQFGESVLLFDYPGFGHSEGSPDEIGCYAAADAAFAWLTKTQGVPPERVILYGKSLGGGVAVELATRHPHRALVLAKTFTSVPEVAQKVYPWLPARWLARSQFNNLGKLPQCPHPVFLTHGDRDELIPFSMTEQLYEAAVTPKRFLPLPGENHNGNLPPMFFAQLKAFLAEVEGTEALR